MPLDDIHLTVDGCDLDQDLARALAQKLAERENPDTFLVSWYNRRRNSHSPCCLGCVIGDRPGWDVYGENHEGRVRLTVNDGEYVFIFS